MKKQNSSERTLDIITREVGMLELDDPKVTPEERRWADGLVGSMNARIAEYRRDRLPKTAPPIKKAEPISKRLLEMPRAALEVLFGSLVEKWGAQMQLAHRHLDELSDNDLRRMIQRIEKHTTRG